MRFLLILLIALALTLAWQSSVVASGLSVDQALLSAQDSKKDGDKQGGGKEEPECE